MIKYFTVCVKKRTILGILHLPAEKNPPCIITCHGLFSSKESEKFITIAQYFLKRGIAVIRFDFGGCGQSTGLLSETTISRRLDELKEVVKYVKKQLYREKVGLLGSSLGGYIAVLYASHDPAITALSIWATPFEILSLRQNIPNEQLSLLKENFFLDAQGYNLAKALSKIEKIQIIHGKKDDIVPCEHAKKIFNCANDPKSLEILATGDHSLTRQKDREKAIQLSFLWFKKNL